MPSAAGPVQPGDEVHIIQACLNKLKPGNSARPFELRVMAFAIRDAAQNWTPQNLQQLVQVVVNKKALEKAGILAEHCAVLSNALIPILPAHKQSIPCAVSRTHSHRRVDFRMLLLNAVQSEFQAGQQQLSATHSVQQSFSAYEAATPSQDSHSQRMLGLVCFISHLFRQGLLTEKIVIACMTQMLQAANGCVAMLQSSLVLMGLTAPLVSADRMSKWWPFDFTLLYHYEHGS